MKTMIKFTALAAASALAAVTVLTVLSCAPEVSITGRDWNEINSGDINHNYTDYPFYEHVPILDQSSYLYPTATSSPQAEAERELTIFFPAGADVLKESNDTIEGKLKTFMTFFSWSSTGLVSNPNGNPLSVFPNNEDYRFIRRATTYGSFGNPGQDITIRLNNVPSANITLKIDGTVYTVYGHKLDINGDDSAGDEVYDDLYFDVPVAGYNTSYIPKGGPVSVAAYQNWTLNLHTGLDNASADLSGLVIAPTLVLAELFTPGMSVNSILAPTDYYNARQAVLGQQLAGKIVLQKYDEQANEWRDDRIGEYDSDSSPTNPNYGKVVVRSFVAADMGVYRVQATGVKDLITDNEYQGYRQKIEVSSYTGAHDGFKTNIVNSGWKRFYMSTNHITQSTSPISSVLVNHDRDGKNVTIELFVRGLYTTTSLSANWLPGTAPALEAFNNTFKLAYRTNGSIWDIRDHHDLAYIKITDVRYGNSSYYDNGYNYNTITLTLDKDYTLDGKTVHVFIAPEFKYSNPQFYFGDINAIDVVINGQNCWRDYGALPSQL